MTPTRIQRSRAKGATTPANTKYCGRPGRWGNPFVVNRHDAKYWRVAVNSEDPLKNWCIGILIWNGAAGFQTKHEAQAHAAKLYGLLLDSSPASYPVHVLAKYTHLSCWCALDAPCHVDEIIKRINNEQ